MNCFIKDYWLTPSKEAQKYFTHLSGFITPAEYLILINVFKDVNAYYIFYDIVIQSLLATGNQEHTQAIEDCINRSSKIDEDTAEAILEAARHNTFAFNLDLINRLSISKSNDKVRNEKICNLLELKQESKQTELFITNCRVIYRRTLTIAFICNADEHIINQLHNKCNINLRGIFDIAINNKSELALNYVIDKEIAEFGQGHLPDDWLELILKQGSFFSDKIKLKAIETTWFYKNTNRFMDLARSESKEVQERLISCCQGKITNNTSSCPVQ